MSGRRRWQRSGTAAAVTTTGCAAWLLPAAFTPGGAPARRRQPLPQQGAAPQSAGHADSRPSHPRERPADAGGLPPRQAAAALGTAAVAAALVARRRHRRCPSAHRGCHTGPSGARRASSLPRPAGAAPAAPAAYDHGAIEARWQQFWAEDETFKTPERGPDSTKPKKYILDMFPYPSGQGLHVGHPLGYTATDVYARFYRAQGYDVLHPMGWDAFGLPAEQYAIQTGQHPAVTTRQNIDNFRRQLKSLGFSYDWEREVATIDDAYVKWTQWIFLQLFKKDLAFQEQKPVNWCAALGTVLANEEVIDGKSERGDHPVTRLPIRQWVLKIGLYADKLLADLNGVDWPSGTMDMQRAWIGESEGASIVFELRPGEGSEAAEAGGDLSVEVFTTRPDTLFGVTHVVLAPEHPLVQRICSSEHEAEVLEYVEATAQKSDRDREMTAKAATGKPLGAFAVHPLTSELVPVWIADYVLGSYGTGAVMSVPAHDERDFTFASLHGLPTDKVVVAPAKKGKEPVAEGEGGAFTERGVSCNSADPSFDGLPTKKMAKRVIQALSEKSVGQRKVQYRLGDWLFSRQRYWGEPIPIYFPCRPDTANGADPADFDPRRGDPVIVDYGTPMPVDESELPLLLPSMEDFSPTGDAEGRLAQALEWRFFEKDGSWYCRESNTMPQWAGSCWYYLRYCDPSNDSALVSSEAERAWMPVDLYVGGKEHAVLHLLYARFWHKVLHEIGAVSTAEPFQKLIHQGLILGTDGEKMSKSRGNVVNPDDVIGEFGSDALRLYEMSMGPLENEKPWQTQQISGVVRFRDRVFKVCEKGSADAEFPKETEVLMHKTIKAVTEQTERMSFNTAITALIVFSNALEKLASAQGSLPREPVEALVLLVQPYAPHLAEECWQSILGNEGSAARAAWPTYREELCVETEMTLPVQVNGKAVKAAVSIAKDASAEEVEAAALALDKVQKAIKDREIKKCIYVPGRIVNFLVK